MTELTDWPALEREAVRPKIAKAPHVDVRVAFRCDCPREDGNDAEPGALKYATWPGQVYGSLAVVLNDYPPKGCCRSGQTPEYGYQLIHGPTGLLMADSYGKGSDKRIRTLALELNTLPIDWAAITHRGFHEHEARWRVRDLVDEWNWRYGSDLY